MSAARVYADFHNLDDENRLRLTCAGTQQDLQRLGIQLQAGLGLTFWTDDGDDQGRPDELLADGTVLWNSDEACWVAQIDWQKLYHASDSTAQENGTVAAPVPPRTPAK
jgi:hypothetical protein